jgi:peptidoglycan/xylan/chitin deacetylase (PgdA/CDA1 family)
MIFLTYHKVREDSRHSPGDFYTVSKERLAEQLETLRTREFREISLPDLLSKKADERSYALSFDDGTTDHFDVVLPVLQERGRHGIFFFPTSKLNRRGHFTLAQVRELAAAGHAIGSHGHDHIRLDVLPADEIERQLSLSMEIIADVTGTPPVIFAPPGGYLNKRVQSVAARLGLRAIRTMKWGLNAKLDLSALECIPLNRHVTRAQFSEILNGRGLGWLKFLYLSKQFVKAIVPSHAYERLRYALMKSRKQD